MMISGYHRGANIEAVLWHYQNWDNMGQLSRNTPQLGHQIPKLGQSFGTIFLGTAPK